MHTNVVGLHIYDAKQQVVVPFNLQKQHIKNISGFPLVENSITTSPHKQCGDKQSQQLVKSRIRKRINILANIQRPVIGPG